MLKLTSENVAKQLAVLRIYVSNVNVHTVKLDILHHVHDARNYIIP